MRRKLACLLAFALGVAPLAVTQIAPIAGGGGSGNVVGPASSTDNALARFDGTTGKLLQNSVGILTDLGALSGITIDTGVITSGTLGVARGGTGLSSGTSGGILGFTATGTIASSALLTANALLLGGGAGATPSALGSLGTTTTVLHGNAAGAPTFAAVTSADVTGVTGTGDFVLATSPTLVTPTLGVATGTRFGLGAAADASNLLLLDGSADVIQARIQGHSTQTAALQVWEKSDGTDVVAVNVAPAANIGVVQLTPTVGEVGVSIYDGTTRFLLFTGSGGRAVLGTNTNHPLTFRVNDVDEVSFAPGGPNKTASDSQWAWTASATDATGAADTGLKREAAAAVAVSDGSTGYGTLRVLREGVGAAPDSANQFFVSGGSGTAIAAVINNGTSTGKILELQDNGSIVGSFTDGMRSATFDSNGLGLGAATTSGVEFYISSTDAAAHTIARFINNAADGAASLSLSDSAGSRFGQLSQWGSTATGNLFGTGKAGFTVLSHTGGAGLMVGTIETDPVIIGVNDTEAVRVSSVRHVSFTSTAPTINSCGTTPSIAGSDTEGQATVGTTPGATCTVNFGSAYTTAPRCLSGNNTTAAFVTASASTTVLTLTGTFLAGDKLQWLCFGD